MLHHRTVNPNERAWHIACQVSREQFDVPGDDKEVYYGAAARYEDCLRELTFEAADAEEGE